MMIILLLVLLLLLLPLITVIIIANTYNNNNNNVIKIKTIIKRKIGCALKNIYIYTLKVATYIVYLISYSVKKMLLNSVFVSVKVICCF